MTMNDNYHGDEQEIEYERQCQREYYEESRADELGDEAFFGDVQ